MGKKLAIFFCLLSFLNAEQVSWAKHLLKGEALPQNRFVAVYFSSDKPKQTFKEVVKNISIDYVRDRFHGIESGKFAAYWGGEFYFDKTSTKRLAFRIEHQKVRIIIDDKIIFKSEKNPREDLLYTFTKGKHKIEVELMNAWHTTRFNFALQDGFKEYSEEEVAREIRKKFKDFDVLEVSVFEAKQNKLTLELMKSKRPIVLLLSSVREVNFTIKNPYENKIIAILLYNKNSIVKGSYKLYYIKEGYYSYKDFMPKCECKNDVYIDCTTEAYILDENKHILELFDKRLYGFSKAYEASWLKVPMVVFGSNIERQVREAVKKNIILEKKCIRKRNINNM